MEVLLEVRATTAPPDGASPFSSIKPVADAPPMIEAGLTTILPSSAETVNAFCPTPDAVMRAAVSVVTGGLAAAVTVKVAVVDPAGTVTLDGTETRDGRLLLRLTKVPPVGAGFGSVTVAMTESPFRT